jgi:hypothetical protein
VNEIVQDPQTASVRVLNDITATKADFVIDQQDFNVGEKTAGVGHFTIPTAPAAGVSCTSGAANVFTTTYVQLIASTSAALFITGIYVEEAAALRPRTSWCSSPRAAGGSETVVGQYLIPPSTGSTVTRSYRPIYPPIPVANATRIACKTADSVGAAAKLITLECIAQSNVVDDRARRGRAHAARERQLHRAGQRERHRDQGEDGQPRVHGRRQGGCAPLLREWKRDHGCRYRTESVGSGLRCRAPGAKPSVRHGGIRGAPSMQ